MRWASALNVVLGLWLLSSAWAAKFMFGPARVNEAAIGLAIALAGIWSMAAMPGVLAPAYINLALGVWLLLSAAVITDGAYGAGYATSPAAIGVLVVIFSAIRLGGSRRVTPEPPGRTSATRP